MDITIKELDQLTDQYFNELTPEKFAEDCKKANVEFFNTVDDDIIGESEQRLKSVHLADIGKTSTCVFSSQQEITDFGAFYRFVTEAYKTVSPETIHPAVGSADDYRYSLAA